MQPDRTLLLPDQTTDAMPLLIALHGKPGNKDLNLEVWEVAVSTRLAGSFATVAADRYFGRPGRFLLGR